jgi:cell division septum initiation protein DivIVA
MLADVADAVEHASPEMVRIPVEVAAEAAAFKVVGRGYDPRQVDAHVAALEQELAELRWEHDELAAQRLALAAQRAEQERWTPSFRALGDRMVQLVRLAEQEACALRTAATQEAARQREETAVEFAAQQAEQARALEHGREVAQREMRLLDFSGQSRRELLETEWKQARRDAELEVAGTLGRAAAQAQHIQDQAARQASAALAAARADVDHLQRRRDELSAEMIELSAQLVAVVQRLSPPTDQADTIS